MSLGVPVARVPSEATAFVGREARFDMSADAAWDDPAIDAAAIDWCRDAMAIAQPDAVVGRYGNEVAESGPDVSRSIYGEATYARLAGIKRAWDKDNVFRLNHNIEPATG